jgi:purine-binding chemotaxis protein CheW
MEERVETYLTFSLGDESFAIDVVHVEKILEYQQVTKVPKAPAYMLGVFNLRGEVIPLIDTKMKFGMPPTQVSTSTCVLVLTINADDEIIKLGALVDSVKEVVKYEKQDIKPLPNIGKQNKSEFINGVLKVEDKFILLLNADKIFTMDEVVELKADNFDLTEE